MDPTTHAELSDSAIIDLYHNRSETAIAATERKYGRYCYTVAVRILHNEQDAEECVNDTWLRAWGAMPPAKPTRLGAFLAAITRHLALDRLDHRHAKGRDSLVEVSEEFWLCVPSNEGDIPDEAAFYDRLNRFLGSLDCRTRVIFLRRYWYAIPIREIAEAADMSEGAVKTLLHRTRKKLKDFFDKEGVSI